MAVVPNAVPNPALYRARWVLPVSSPPIEDGAVIVRGLSIDNAGPYSEMKQLMPKEAYVDLGDVAILPGLINCHTHLDNAVLADSSLRETNGMVHWVRDHQKTMAEFSIAQIREAYRAALDSLPSLGTLAVADITSLTREKLPPAREPLWSLSFFEVRGFDSERAEENFQLARENIRQARTMVSGVWSRFAMSAHGPHSLYKEVLQRVAEVCRTKGDVFTLHCAESEDEVEFLQTGGGAFAEMLKDWGYWQEDWQPPGKSPVQYLHESGCLDSNTMAVHCVHLDEKDLDTMALSNATACLCPRSNQTIATGTAPAMEMFDRGIPMVLGTDGLGSAPDLDLFAEMAACRKLYPGLPAGVILEMATLNAARALRVDSVLGSFEPNKLGRFLVYSGDLGNDPAEALVSGIDREKLEWAGGEIDMRP